MLKSGQTYTCHLISSSTVYFLQKRIYYLHSFDIPVRSCHIATNSFAVAPVISFLCMKIILSFCCFLFSLIVFAQPAGFSPADSLKKAVAAHPGQDSVRVNLLIMTGEALLGTDPSEALNYTRQALELSGKIKWKDGLVAGYRQLATCYYKAGDLPRAVEYNLKSLKAGAYLKNEEFDASIYNNLALIHTELSEFDKADGYYKRCLDIFTKLDQRYELAAVLLNRGMNSYRSGALDQALSYLDRSVKIADDSSYTQIGAYAYNNRGAVLNSQKKFENAVSAFQKSIQLAGISGDYGIQASSLGGQGEAFLHLKEYGKAKDFCEKGLAIARQQQSIIYEKEIMQILSDIYKAERRYDKALEAWQQYIILRDSILNAEKRTEIARNEIQHEFEKKEALIKTENEKREAIAGAEIRRQRLIKNAAMSGGAGLLMAGSFIFVLYKRRRDAEKQTTEAELKAEILNVEMKALRAQMNPHFIFNSLNSISNYISRNDIKAADDYLLRFARLMRQILENSEKREVSLEDDLQALEDYMRLELMRLREKFSYAITVDEAIDTENTMIPPLLLQPFVENSIWHGIANKQGAGKINIFVKREGEMICCTIEDDGLGRKYTASRTEDEKKSLGMKITQSRLDLLNRLRKSSSELKLVDLAEGLRVEVRLPFILNH